MIEVEGLYKSYGASVAVQNVSFVVDTGEVLGLLGPNGAGKTTLMKILTGYHFADAGSARIDGFDVASQLLECKSIIGYLPEHAPLYGELSVLEYLEFAAGAQMAGTSSSERRQAIETSLDRCGLRSVLHQPIETLSKGFRQRVGLAQAILHNPKVLILDEPTTGLDPNQITEIRSLIKDLARDKTIILSTHIMQEVEAVCSRVAILNAGQLVADGSPESIRSQLRAGGQYAVLLEAAPELVEASSASLPGCTACQSEGRQAGLYQYRLFFSQAVDEAFGHTIVSWSIDNKLGLCGLSLHKASLEEVFAQLTAAKEPARAAGDAA